MYRDGIRDIFQQNVLFLNSKNRFQMPTKSFKLNIAEPCAENWDTMTPTDCGKFCAACQKSVVDFSSMTDREIYDRSKAVFEYFGFPYNTPPPG